MKREILFKSKRQDNNQWVEGLIAYLFDTEYISQGYDDVPARKYYIITPDQEFVEIIPNTICQFTGIKDKNGNKVFEGDEVVLTSDLERPYHKELFEVKYTSASFTLKPLTDTQYKQYTTRLDSQMDLEIIGNIHD